MTTVVELEIPAARLGFDRTFDRVSTFEFQVGGMIGDSPPLIWASGPDRDAVARALEADPSVDVIASLGDGGESPTGASDGAGTDVGPGDRWLFRTEFGDAAKLFTEIVTDNDGAILTARGRNGRWLVKLLFHDRESVSACHDLLEQYEYRATVTRISGVDDLASAQTPLTETQYETICKAHELGYFDVPRGVTLKELAAELDVSHQALSERLRRSHAALVSAELSERTAPMAIDP
ncbi:Bacterio-opsin activator HTH domain protein [Natrinema pellirubrum DSM 15624]|uniref:Bacterio-opsin activator HTH domain protein n=1 Tax=Natrinema pellirubrum (strain DSM 15624 / CIP 106293 / JCM 10476 / NCIMB 786 / 157) TaxID=797303 RepID=L0JNH2_NATP1|nr:helix-turn-helix domain-containing protein [Natrinema pellirubrum]AGB31911.1 putative DNA binding protein [Natrinema pellirubrum DSM 15624]ELY77744.1 Bacterio-opsin activator HTH domain protein [Natrinema pellirubrum DSM 15624]